MINFWHLTVADHTWQRKHLTWNTLSLAFLIRSLGLIPSPQPPQRGPYSLEQESGTLTCSNTQWILHYVHSKSAILLHHCSYIFYINSEGKNLIIQYEKKGTKLEIAHLLFSDQWSASSCLCGHQGGGDIPGLMVWEGQGIIPGSGLETNSCNTGCGNRIFR